MGTMYSLRGISVIVTGLSNPYPPCQPLISKGAVETALNIMAGKNFTCGDVFFSGHTIYMTCMALVWQDYTPNRILKAWVWIATCGGYLVIICTHFHYTLDVLYGAALTASVWRFYHHIIKLRQFVEEWAFLAWFEQDAYAFFLRHQIRPQQAPGGRRDSRLVLPQRFKFIPTSAYYAVNFEEDARILIPEGSSLSKIDEHLEEEDEFGIELEFRKPLFTTATQIISRSNSLATNTTKTSGESNRETNREPDPTVVINVSAEEVKR
eukprot:GILI01013399.1.p1 GENE.GILI01013399.1~~GILI01013399.1.p1  ORF type:complete len:266 (-),score=41.86 GILI01013399.1:329-1126(-)